jgi:hypothetical protein
MATSGQRTIARALVPSWGAVLDDTLDVHLDIAARSVGETEYGDAYDQAVALTAAMQSAGVTDAERAAHERRLMSIRATLPATLPFVVS